MGSLDAFYSTWSKARETFGQGTPQDGSRFDGSSRLVTLSEGVAAAAPDGRWQGPASDAYASKNQDHVSKYVTLAGLDKKVSAEVTNAANVVATGRQNLDEAKSWVDRMAQAVPADLRPADRDAKLTAIANQGLSRISTIISNSHNEMSTIAGRFNGITGEYQAMGGPGKPKEGPVMQALGNENEKEGDGKDDNKDGKPKGDTPPPPVDREQARDDVERVLAGTATPQELSRVREGLRLSPEQQAAFEANQHVQLSPQQKQVLGQMRAQTHGMSIDELKNAQDKLKNYGSLIPDAMQMMSDDQFDYAKVPLQHGALGSLTETMTGNTENLPTQVLSTLHRDTSLWGRMVDPLGAATDNAHQMSTLSDLVRNGTPSFQHSTGLDKAMLDWTASSLAHPTAGLAIPGSSDESAYTAAKEEALSNVFYAAGQDHFAVGQEMQGKSGEQFLDSLHKYRWDDPSHSGSVHGIMDWIASDAHSSNIDTATNAGQSAHALASYLDGHPELLKQDALVGHESIGNYNQALLEADAKALAPFQRAMIGDPEGTHGFGDFGHPGDGNFQAARNVFAIIDSDPTAAKEFNAAAEKNILQYQNDFAKAVVADPSMQGHSPDLAGAQHAANLMGVVNGAADDEAISRGLNEDERKQAVYDLKKGALDMLLPPIIDQVPKIDKVPESLLGFTKDQIVAGILGDDPAPQNPDDVKRNVSPYTSAQGFNMTAYRVAEALHAAPGGSIDLRFFNEDGHLKSPNEIGSESDKILYGRQLQAYMSNRSAALGDAFGALDNAYNHGTGAIK